MISSSYLIGKFLKHLTTPYMVLVHQGGTQGYSAGCVEICLLTGFRSTSSAVSHSLSGTERTGIIVESCGSPKRPGVPWICRNQSLLRHWAYQKYEILRSVKRPGVPSICRGQAEGGMHLLVGPSAASRATNDLLAKLKLAGIVNQILYVDQILRQQNWLKLVTRLGFP